MPRDDDDRPLTTAERVAAVRAATDKLAQIEPDREAVKQRQSAARARCKRAKVRERYRKVGADIAALEDDLREGALGELAIAHHAHELPIALPMPVDPQLELPLGEAATKAALDDCEGRLAVDRKISQEIQAIPQDTPPAFEDADPASAATLDDPKLDTLGWTVNGAGGCVVIADVPLIDERNIGAAKALAELPGGRLELAFLAGVAAGKAGEPKAAPAELGLAEQGQWLAGWAEAASTAALEDAPPGDSTAKPTHSCSRQRRALMPVGDAVAGHA